MRRTTIFADDALLNEMKELARQEQKSVAELVRAAMDLYIRTKRKPAKKLSIIGIGESSRSDIAETHEELLWQKPSQ
ncbi:MAG: ribbon-helix-helix protein, CopG family [Deltaproteobacteria bacterium]|nr:ribbon-helix-helix protein, CopG family [Deltaproteobacteria bacterium]